MAGDPKPQAKKSAKKCFNPRPRMAGDAIGNRQGHALGSFNPRPRMAGDASPSVTIACIHVSIHARAWRATTCRLDTRFHLSVSIHARAWRATRFPISSGVGAAVSIHARAWRATRGGEGRHARPCRFNPRPRMAGDTATTTPLPSLTRFNPRPRMAGDIDSDAF